MNDNAVNVVTGIELYEDVDEAHAYDRILPRQGLKSPFRLSQKLELRPGVDIWEPMASVVSSRPRGDDSGRVSAALSVQVRRRT